MSSNDYVVRNIYRYSRKSYKAGTRREDISVADDFPDSPRSERVDTPGCSCDIDPESEMASILHKKCPVIALAHQQLQKLLEETDRVLCENTRCCRSVGDFLLLCKRAILDDNKCRCALLIFIIIFFFIGIFLGAASCGVHQRKFNSPILTCLDNLFITDYPKVDMTRAII